ncbi:MAG: hypothetical protein Fur0016_22740 [Anaerolineales bacterium]
MRLILKILSTLLIFQPELGFHPHQIFTKAHFYREEPQKNLQNLALFAAIAV